MFLNKSVVSSLSMALLLSACSGSDGYGVGNGNPDETDGTTTDTGTDDTTTPVVEVIEALGSGSGTDFESGVLTTDIVGDVLSLGDSATITVNVVDTNSDNDLLQTPTSVLFSSVCASQGLATIGESALSASGQASVTYSATSCTGSDTITAITTDTDANVSTATATISISSLDLGNESGVDFVTGEMTTSITTDSLTYGGDTIVSVNVVDTNGNELYTASSVTVDFTSNCVQQGKSTISSSVSTSTGTAVATYTANTCEGPDTITASLSDGTSADVDITVAEQVLGELAFVEASPKTIALKGSGSSENPEVTTVSFSLKDATGEPMAGEEVHYSLSTDVGGISLANESSVTDLEGNTSVQLNAGGVNVSVAVIATVTVTYGDGSSDTTVTQSDSIAVLGGLPDQDSFTLSVERFNPRGYDISGTTSRMTVHAGDRFNNEARNGTQISFVTTGGQIDGSCALDGGVCSVDWTSSNPRPDNGIVHILARTTGEESFVDANLNGQFDLGETIDEELDEAYIDVNYNGVRDANEFYSDFNNDELYNDKENPGFFQGASCSQDAEDADHCENLVDVRRVATICMSTDDVLISGGETGGVLTQGSGFTVNVDALTQQASVDIIISDLNGLMPANGSSVAVSVEHGEIIAGSTISIPNACNIDNAGNPIPFINTIVVEADTQPETDSGTLKVSVTRPDGVVEEFFVIFNH